MVDKKKPGSAKGSKPISVDTVAHNGNRYTKGMCVLINPDAAAPAYIGRIKSLSQLSSDPNDVELEVTWFYRPEEAVGGRKKFHGEAEVFDSEHMDRVHKNSILGPCQVHSIKQFEALTTRSTTDFYSRFKYKPTTKEFDPDRVPVYCKCELPYNPDNPMVQCSQCKDWYHPECLKMPASILEQEHFVCDECVSLNDNLPRKSIAGPSSKR